MSFRTSTTLPDSGDRSYAFPRAKRLTRGPDIERVRKEGKRVRTSCLEVRATASLHSFPRVGVVVPKYGHTAVDRNRVKRQLRELIRTEVLPALPPMDVVLKAAPRGYNRSFDELRQEARQVHRQLVKQFGAVGQPLFVQEAPRANAPVSEPRATELP